MLSCLQKSPAFRGRNIELEKIYCKCKSYVAISVVPASAEMRASVADRSWILAVEIAVMTPRTASIVSATVSTTIVAVVVVLIADDVISWALGVLNTGGGLTEVVVALVSVRAVVGVDTA